MGNPKLFVAFFLLMLLLSTFPVMVKPASGSTDDNSSWTVAWHDPRVYGSASSELYTNKSTTVMLSDPANHLTDNIALVVSVTSYGPYDVEDVICLRIALYFESSGTEPYYFPDYALAVCFNIIKSDNGQDMHNHCTSLELEPDQLAVSDGWHQGYNLTQKLPTASTPDNQISTALKTLAFGVGLFCQPVGVATSMISLATSYIPQQSYDYENSGSDNTTAWIRWEVPSNAQPLYGLNPVRQYGLDLVRWLQKGQTNPVQSYSINVSATVFLQQSTNSMTSPFGYYVDTPPVTLTIDHNQNQTLLISTSGGDQQCTTYPYLPRAYSFLCGSSVTVTAVPHDTAYYYFGHWELDGVFAGYYISISVTMTTNHSLEAHFYYNPPPPPGGGGGGGGCPYVASWNGTGYVLDNNVLPSSEISGGGDVKDYYRLEQPFVPVFQCTMASLYSLRISEFEHEHDYIDQVKLLAVDHAADVNVGVSPSGEILTYKNPAPPISAISNDGANVLSVLNASDGSYYEGYNGSYMTLTFAPADVSAGAKLVMREDYHGNWKDPIYFQVLNSTGQWNTVIILVTRNNWATDAINMTGYLPDAQGNLTVRLYFTATSRIDYVGLDTTPQAAVQVRQAWLVGAFSSSQGDVARLLKADDERYAELVPGQQILLTFMLPTSRNSQRTFILYTEGHYTTIS